MKMHAFGIVLGLFLVFLVVFGAVLVSTYRKDIKEAYRRLENYEPKTLEVSGKRVEYRIEGDGPAVLIVHGNSGGHDQAMQTGTDFFGEGFRIVAVSRFGFLGSELPEDSSPRAQADVYRHLLDKERIDSAIVLGVSAGGAPSIRFALDYPDLTDALILVAADVPSPQAAKATGPPHFLLHDFPFWLMTRPLRPVLFRMFGLDGHSYQNAPEPARAGVDRLFATLLPMEPRREGVTNDELVTNMDMSRNYDEYPLETLKAPTLIFQAKDDPLASYKKVQKAAERIPSSRLELFEEGGHLLFGYSEEIDAALGDFLSTLGVIQFGT